MGIAALAVVPACGSKTDNAATQGSEGTAATSHGDGPTFAYEGADGPANWGKLDTAWATCADGTSQSPIDITDPTPTDLPNPTISYVAGQATVINNGHTIEAEAAPGSSITLDGTTYPFAQMHFHAPSEHTIGGVHAAAELHFVNKTADGKIAVIGVLVQPGPTDNPAIQPFVSAASVPQGQERDAELDYAAMLPTGPMIRYSGSLTTPPCTQGVSWIVMQQPITASSAQLAALTAAYDGNDRPVQPLDGRPVQLDTTP